MVDVEYGTMNDMNDDEPVWLANGSVFLAEPSEDGIPLPKRESFFPQGCNDHDPKRFARWIAFREWWNNRERTALALAQAIRRAEAAEAALATEREQNAYLMRREEEHQADATAAVQRAEAAERLLYRAHRVVEAARTLTPCSCTFGANGEQCKECALITRFLIAMSGDDDMMDRFLRWLGPRAVVIDSVQAFDGQPPIPRW